MIYDEVLFPPRMRKEPALESSKDLASNKIEATERAEHEAFLGLEGKSLLVFSPTNPVRVFLARIVTRKWYRLTINSLGVLSSLLLIITSPLKPSDSGVNRAITVVEYVDETYPGVYLLLLM
jgi:hypothetical protein